MTKKYNWSVSVNAPKNFPATLHYGYLGNESIRGKGTLNSGWGLGGSVTGGNEPQKLPKTLDIVWMSYVENQFYEGHFELDQKKLQKMFEEGYKEDLFSGVVTSHDFDFTINVAPGGLVAIWLGSVDGVQKEFGYYQAQKTDVVWKEFVPHGEQNRALYVSNRLENHLAEDILNSYKTEGIPFNRWKTYAEPYTWDISIKNKPHMVYLYAYTFNGEQYRIHQKFVGIKKDIITSGLPRKFNMQWEETLNAKEAFTAKCKFKDNDYKMLTDTFKANANKGSFIIEPYVDNNIKRVKLFLVTGTTKQEIQLEQNTVKRVVYKSRQ